MQGRRSSVANKLKSSLLCIKTLICYLLPVNMKLFWVSDIVVHAHPLLVVSMQVIIFYLNGGLLTCLYFIINQVYNVICIFAKHL